MPENKTIIVVSNEPWGDIWYSKQNWAYELSKNNNLVFFLSPPPKFNFLRIFKKPNAKKISDNLFEITYCNFLPLTVKSLICAYINDLITGLKITKIINKIAGNSQKILFSFDPFRFLKPSSLGVHKSLFFYVDVYRNKGLRKILNNVDFIVTVSNELTKNLKIKKPILKLSHAISSEEFIVNEVEACSLNISIPKDEFCIYVGSIDHKLDYKLIRLMSESFPSLKFLFVGPLSNELSEENKQLFNNNPSSNIIYHPPVFFKNLKYYISKAKFAIAPLSTEQDCYLINSHKLLQYFALGKPVLSPLFKEYADKPDLLYPYSTHEESIAQINQILVHEPNEILTEKRIEFAKQHVYSELMKKIDLYFEQKHICYTIATSFQVPYFTWFMNESKKNPSIRYSFIVLDKSPNELTGEIKQKGYNAYWIRFYPERRKRHMLLAALKMFFLFKQIRPDVVHSQLFDDAVPSMLASRLAGIKKRVITKQDTAYHYHYARRWVFFDKFNNMNATHVLAVSHEAHEFIKTVEKCPQRKIYTIHHGIDPEQFLNPDVTEQQFIRKKYAREDGFVIGTLARFIHWKNYHHIIEAAEICLRRHKDMFFVFWGSGDLKDEIQNLIKNKNLQDNVKIADYYPRTKIQNVYAALDLYLHAAHMEPFGFVIAEAMMSGLPVVSTPTGAAKDAIIHKQNGWLAQYNNTFSLVEGIEYFYNNRVEKPWLPACETALTMYNIRNMYESYLKLYEK